MTANQFRAAIKRLGISQRALVRKLRLAKSERTARRWALGEAEVPECVAILLRLMLAGKITIEDVENASRP